MPILNHLKNVLPQFSKPHLLVAYSGGMDSHVLLHALKQLQKNDPDIFLRAIHLNHGLNPKAAEWQQHAMQICADLDIPLQTHALNLVLKQGESIEARAREARYEYFAKILQEGEILCTAHHQDDQLETVLLQLMRGAGPKGLAAMPSLRAFERGYHARPLLEMNHNDILSYAKTEQLNWINDDSNQSTQFDRNFLRHQIIPTLKQRFPAAAATASRSAQHCASAQHLLEDYLEQELLQLTGDFPRTLSRKKIAQSSLEKQYYLLRNWLIARNISLPSTTQLAQIQQLITARNDSAAKVTWQGYTACFYQDSLFAEKSIHFARPVDQTLMWDGKQPFILPQDLGTLTLSSCAQGLLSPRILQETLTIRFSHQSEYCKVAGHKHTRPIKKILQDLKLPLWQRWQLPYLYVNNELAAIGDRLVMLNYARTKQESTGLKLDLKAWGQA